MGYLYDGDGVGWKMGQSDRAGTDLKRVVRNCIAAYCYCLVNAGGGLGFTENTYFSYMYRINIHVYNNLSYHNGYGFSNGNSLHTPTPDGQNWYRNNIAYQNTLNTGFDGVYYHDHNTWDSNVSLSDADFISLDTTGMSGPRQSDGSLPDITFGKLAAGSDLIDAGTPVGLLFNGTAPDLGWSEYCTPK
jgi:hypothetical protein